MVGSKPCTRAASGCYRIQNVNSLHARYKRFIKTYCGPATTTSTAAYGGSRCGWQGCGWQGYDRRI